MEGKIPKLDARLGLLAQWVRPGQVVADIGCDHGYLSAFLVGTEKCPKALCCDIHQAPLARAEETARLCGLTEKMELRLADGLQDVGPDEAGDIVIAGMGGDLIARLVLETPWLRSPDKHLLLSPMTKAHELRRSLCEDGFSIQRERGVRVGKFLYTVMEVTFTGKAFSPDEIYARTGELPRDGDPGSVEYLLHQVQVALKIGENLKNSNTNCNKSKEYNEIAGKIRALIENGGK